MKLQNKSTRSYIAFDVILKAGEILEVADKKTAEILLKQPDVCEYADVETQRKLEEENEKLKAKVALQEAKEKADGLGIQYPANIGLAKLLEKIAEAEKQAQ